MIMANVLLSVTGSVAALRTPQLHGALKQAGHQVKIVATEPSLYFFDLKSLPPGVVHRDQDEWPRRGTCQAWQRYDPVLHIELRRWADLFLIAPLDANTLAKLAGGLCDNCLTCVWRAWDPLRPVVLAPAMNTFMWEHPLTKRHLRQLALDHGILDLPENLGLDALIEASNVQCPRLQIVAPRSKRLACGDVGVGALAEVDELVDAVQHLLSRTVASGKLETGRTEENP
jgi:phosphopantothenoylcysteine decarboxylase